MHATKTLAALLAALPLSLALHAAAARAQTPSPDEAAPPRRAPLRLVVTSGISGDIVPLACDGERTPPALQVAAADVAGEPGVLALDSGNLVGVGALGRFMIARDAAAFARAVGAMHLRALALGHLDLAGPRPDFVRAAVALAGEQMPYVATNLTCDPGVGLCDALVDAGDPAVVVTTPVGRVAVLAVMAPAWLTYIARENAAGLHLADPLATVIAGVRSARSAGADYVVVTYDPDSGSALPDALALSSALPEDARPDVLVVNGLGPATASHESPNGVVLAAARPGRGVVVAPDVAHPTQRPRAGSVPEELTRFIAEANVATCRELSAPTAGGRIEGQIERDTFADAMLDVLRVEHHADLAVINRGSLARAPFPMPGPLSRMSLLAAFPYDNALFVGRVRGSVLRDLARSPRAAWFYLRGLTVVGDAVKINGRPVEADSEYVVVTSDYVATRGDGGLGDDTIRWRPVADSLRGQLLAWYARPHRHPVNRPGLDLTHRTRWSLRWTLDASASSVAIENPSPLVYSDTQFARAQSFTLRGDTEFRADADRPSFGFENSLRLRYGLTQTISTMGVNSGLAEDTDVIALRSTYAFNRLHSDNPRFYVPEPFAEMYTESEFVRPSQRFNAVPGARDYHHLLFRPSVGLRFEIAERFTVFGGAGLSWETLQPGAVPVPGLIAGWVLRPGTLFRIENRPVAAESTLDFSYRDWFGTPSTQIRFSARLTIPLFDVVSLMLGYDLFARYDTGQQRWGWAGDATVGLRMTLARQVQAFIF